ncbi:MAG: DPP IV N-terminal domain-containing protein, partial [Pirellulaceae bacterium]|nr:DPP IV N-terminal domain-containing protein [Pirellulaceae bacterium]
MNHATLPLSRRIAAFAAAACLLCVLASAAVLAQGSKADYERSDDLRRLVEGKVAKSRVEPRWFADGKKLWYRLDLGAGGREFVLVDAEAGSRQAAFDHAKLAEELAKKLGKEVEAAKLPIDGIEFVDQGAAVRFPAEGKHWKWTLADGSLAETEAFELPRPAGQPAGRGRRGGQGRGGPPPGERSNRSPDGQWSVEVRDHNLFLRPAGESAASESPEAVQLTTDGTAEHYYEGNVRWAPDSSRFVDQLQPKLHTHDYLKPGDRIAQSKPCLFEIASKKQIPIDDSLFQNPWDISQLRWSADSRRLTLLYNQRGHQVVRLVAIAADTGEAGTIIDETSKTFVDYSSKQFLHYADDSHELIWASERDGWNHLYLYDSRTGDVKNQITRGEWLVRGVDRVDDEARQIWFRACGIYPEQDPYYVHHCRINWDGTGLVVLTAGNGTHEVDYSPNRRYLLDTWSRVDQPPVTELRRTEDGSLVCQLEEADWSELLATGWQIPERFVAPGRDGQTPIYGVIFRPTNFDPNKKYPVVEQIYAGPQSAFVPKRFSAYHGPQGMAELGFIVVQIDGMGTNWRSKAFHDVCWQNLGDSGFPDRIAWLKAAAAKYPQLDLSRVGVYGG